MLARASYGAGRPPYPKSSVEQQEINRLQERDSADPDRDGVIEGADKCPTVAGRPENLGCPDQDRDEDGIFDRDDECPDDERCPLERDDCVGWMYDGLGAGWIDRLRVSAERASASTPVTPAPASLLYPQLEPATANVATNARQTNTFKGFLITVPSLLH